MSSAWTDFYPRSPRGERPAALVGTHVDVGISIHAPREGSDPARAEKIILHARFLSTLPARGATKAGVEGVDGIVISIHAPREGSDAISANAFVQNGISIHAPREGSDTNGTDVFELKVISIHAPREGSDEHDSIKCPIQDDFYPRSPRGERP